MSDDTINYDYDPGDGVGWGGVDMASRSLGQPIERFKILSV